MKKLLLGLFFLLNFSVLARAQHSTQLPAHQQLTFLQDSLKRLGDSIVNGRGEVARQEANVKFIKTLVSALKVQNSFLFGFDSVKTISILNAPDNRFRIFSWHIRNMDGSYRFYGAIQMNTGGPLKLYPLEDYSPFFTNPQDSVTDNKKWFGAQYYKIIPVYASQPYYVLLGWKGNTPVSTKRVIDAISFKNDNVQLGAGVFDEKGKTHKRVVFEYARDASMLLNYVPSQYLIVFDHLVPPDKKSANKFSTYGPDLSYDGFKLKNGRWEYVENLDMRNIPSEKDASYLDPKKDSDGPPPTYAKPKINN